MAKEGKPPPGPVERSRANNPNTKEVIANLEREKAEFREDRSELAEGLEQVLNLYRETEVGADFESLILTRFKMKQALELSQATSPTTLTKKQESGPARGTRAPGPPRSKTAKGASRKRKTAT